MRTGAFRIKHITAEPASINVLKASEVEIWLLSTAIMLASTLLPGPSDASL